MLKSKLILTVFLSTRVLMIYGSLLDLDILNPVTDSLEDLLKALKIGVTIKVSGTAIKIGLVTVPFDTLCKIPLTSGDGCRLCMLDCINVHNATSGSCGPHPNPTVSDEITCICEYDPETDHHPSVSSICKSYSVNALQSEKLNRNIDIVVIKVLRHRFEEILCSDTLSGCKVDCITNHALESGECTDEFCLCS